MDLLEAALKSLIMDIAASLGVSDLFGESSADVLADQLTKAVDAAKDALLKGTGFEKLLDSRGVREEERGPLRGYYQKVLRDLEEHPEGAPEGRQGMETEN